MESFWEGMCGHFCITVTDRMELDIGKHKNPCILAGLTNLISTRYVTLPRFISGKQISYAPKPKVKVNN